MKSIATYIVRDACVMEREREREGYLMAIACHTSLRTSAAAFVL